MSCSKPLAANGKSETYKRDSGRAAGSGQQGGVEVTFALKVHRLQLSRARSKGSRSTSMGRDLHEPRSKLTRVSKLSPTQRAMPDPRLSRLCTRTGPGAAYGLAWPMGPWAMSLKCDTPRAACGGGAGRHHVGRGDWGRGDWGAG